VNLTLSLFDLKEVGKDFAVLTDRTMSVKITFADQEPKWEGDLSATKEEQAWLLKGFACQVGLEAPVVSVSEPKNINIWLDHNYNFGELRSVPFPYRIASIEVWEIVSP
jgi:hypothetical protein